MIPLLKENIEQFIGKRIEFIAPAYEGNSTYRGVTIIRSVDYNERFPIRCERISGDDLKYAILDKHGLEPIGCGELYRVTDCYTSFSYSDQYREVFIKVI